MKKEKLGIALVGLGTYSEGELAPALQETRYCYLAGVVSGDEKKRRSWQSKYNLKEHALYTYDNFDTIKDNPDIDIVYIVLPNSMHADFVIRAARAGKHIICEKPMATSVDDCVRMIDACSQAGVRLSIGYRLHFDPFNLEMMMLGHHEMYGPMRKIIAKNGMDVGKPGQWRLDAKLAGGGPLMDVGIYCVQGVLYTLGELPYAVDANFTKKTDPEKFKDVEEGIEWKMYFSNGVIAECATSYSEEYNVLRAEATEGTFELEPAYEYRGLKGKTPEGKMKFPEIRQQSKQMDDFAKCVLEDRDTRVPGEMGMRDVEILLAVYEAAKTGRRVELHLEKYNRLVLV